MPLMQRRPAEELERPSRGFRNCERRACRRPFLGLGDGSCCQSCLGWGIAMLTWGGAATQSRGILMGLKSGGLRLDFMASLLSCSTLLSSRCEPGTPDCTGLIWQCLRVKGHSWTRHRPLGWVHLPNGPLLVPQAEQVGCCTVVVEIVHI